MERERFLVTGGAGFIGSHIVERLLKDGHFVRVLDNFSSGKEGNLSFTYDLPPTSYDLIRGDIRNYNTCLKACEGIDYILHQAALRSVPKSMESPHEYNEVNIDGTVNMLQAAREKKVKRFVFASSSSVYGDTDIFPEKEDFLPQLISPYALTKLAGEYYCRIFSEHFNLETVCLRYFNVFGPRQALDDEYAVVIPKFIHCILNDEQPPIFGNGRQSRDFTYIDNVVEANILAATSSLRGSETHPSSLRGASVASDACPQRFVFERKQQGEAISASSPRHCEGLPPVIARRPKADEAISKQVVFHAVFNVANGKDNTVLELVGILNKIIGKNIKPKFLSIRAGDVFRTNADIAKIKSILSYEPKVGFEEGLRKTVEWFRRNLNKMGLGEFVSLKGFNQIWKE